METLPTEFGLAVRDVTISGTKQKRAIKAHTDVRELLEADPELCGWGIDTRLIGSYARHTARYPGKDVDVFLRFTKLSTADDPGVVYDGVAKVLIKKYGESSGRGRVAASSADRAGPAVLHLDSPGRL